MPAAAGRHPKVAVGWSSARRRSVTRRCYRDRLGGVRGSGRAAGPVRRPRCGRRRRACPGVGHVLLDRVERATTRSWAMPRLDRPAASSRSTSSSPRSPAVLCHRPGLFSPLGDRRLSRPAARRAATCTLQPIRYSNRHRLATLPPTRTGCGRPRPSEPASGTDPHPALGGRPGVQYRLQPAKLRQEFAAHADRLPPASAATGSHRHPDTGQRRATSRSPTSIGSAAASPSHSRRARSSRSAPPPSGYFIHPLSTRNAAPPAEAITPTMKSFTWDGQFRPAGIPCPGPGGWRAGGPGVC